MKDTISIETLNWCLRWKSSLSPKDYVVETRQRGVKYLLETLEPEGIDSFQLEFFSIRAERRLLKLCFEDTAAQILKDNPKLKEALQQKKIADPFFLKVLKRN
jgi:hypothetical protein